MRLLFTTTAGLGHLHPLVPLARAAVAAGHEVAFACPRSATGWVEAAGFRAFSVEEDSGPDPERAAAMARVRDLALGHERNALMMADVFVGISARRALPTLLALCRRWAPDVVVREECEFAGAVAAEALGLPHATVQVIFSTDLAAWRRFGPALVRRLDGLRAAVGLPPDPDLSMLFRHLFLSFDPPALLDPAAEMPPVTHHLRCDPFDRSGAETLPAHLHGLRPDPVVYVTLGSEAAKIPGIFPAAYGAILAGAREEAGALVMTVGRHADPAALGPQPAHVHVERYVPQSLLLPACDLVVTHGGHNTVLAALRHGLPLVLVPFFADQGDNAARCAALGVGRVVHPADLTPAAVRAAVRDVLAIGSFRRNAARLRAEMEALPGPEHGVRLLAALAADRTHLPAAA